MVVSEFYDLGNLPCAGNGALSDFSDSEKLGC